ncbi:LysR substrate-binding domain-containing protein [Rhizobium leguminosarum]|uniref:LysR substrate-binding domain-containing protein n=1 Tax=Rhizobium leguminosarum TaxID=384 RepID=UPI001427DFEA|nr:LysR substrate-binding domain-containing protein [Rhizobium leguminosarum]
MTFEAVCRSQNFTNAAADLGITRVAVSRQIADLEDGIQQKLFSRMHRKVVLTAAGEEFANTVNPALDEISHALNKYRHDAGGSRLSVTITTAFATFWLMPRLVDLGSRFPDLEVNLVVSDRYLDLAAENVDIAIRYMPAPPEGDDWVRLMREEIFPVYSPKYPIRTTLTAPVDLLSERLLFLSGQYRPEARWGHWFKVHNLPQPDEKNGVTVNTYINMVQAALEGQGIALAGFPLMNGYLQDGTLVRMTSIEPLMREYYYVLNRSPRKAVTRLFYDWLFEQAASEGYGNSVFR